MEIPPEIRPSEENYKLWEERMNGRGIKTKVVNTGRGYRTHIAQITKLADSAKRLVPLVGECKMPKE